jgi:hypothetical protein
MRRFESLLLRSSMSSSTDLCVHWSVLVHLYGDGTVQVSILYGCSLLVEWGTWFHCYLVGGLYVGVWVTWLTNPFGQVITNLLGQVGKTFWSDNEIVEKATKKIESKEIESFSNDLMQSFSISKKIVQSTISSQKNDLTTSRKRTIKFDNIFSYHDKLIKKYRNYVKNLTTIFRLISNDFSTKDFKSVYVMQFLTEKFKKTWYRFEKQNLDHEYIFKKYCEHLLDLIENLVNHHFHHAQLFSNAKQEENNRCKLLTLF